VTDPKFYKNKLFNIITSPKKLEMKTSKNCIVVKVNNYIPHVSQHQANYQDIAHWAESFSGNPETFQQVQAAIDRE
jgi:hypothetical protein